jgi:hypothetical protein
MKKISVYETVLSGNFGQSDYENWILASSYIGKIKQSISYFCSDEYPDFELEMRFDVDHASGSSRGVVVYVDSDADSSAEIKKMESEIMAEIEREQLGIMDDQWYERQLFFCKIKQEDI